MAQVLTNENMVEFIQTRQAPEFVAPKTSTEGAGSGGSAAGEAVTSGAGTGSSDAQSLQEKSSADASGRERGPDGKFVKTEEKVGDTAAKPADDDDTSELSEAVKRKIDKIIAKKHRAMKEAEEFGADSYRQRLAAEQRAEQLQREIDELKKSGTGPAPAKDNGSDPDEPKPEDFKTVGEYTRALTKYEVKKAAEKAGEASKKQSEQERQRAQAEERGNAFTKRQAEFMKANPDYEEIVEGADFEVPHIGLQFMVESEYGPQLAYHLAKNPEIADRLRTLSPGRVIAELGKLEAKFEKQPEPADTAAAATRSVSRAPAPIIPIEGKTTPVEKDPAKMSFRELREYERQREAARRAR